jgi:uncharacterized protein YciI
MTAEMPPGVAIETIYIVEATYAPDASETRRPFRGEHLRRIVEMRRAGTLLDAGGYADFTSALLLFRTTTAEEALAICRADIYTRSGVWVELSARAWGRVVTEDELRLRAPDATAS